MKYILQGKKVVNNETKENICTAKNAIIAQAICDLFNEKADLALKALHESGLLKSETLSMELFIVKLNPSFAKELKPLLGETINNVFKQYQIKNNFTGFLKIPAQVSDNCTPIKLHGINSTSSTAKPHLPVGNVSFKAVLDDASF